MMPYTRSVGSLVILEEGKGVANPPVRFFWDAFDGLGCDAGMKRFGCPYFKAAPGL